MKTDIGNGTTRQAGETPAVRTASGGTPEGRNGDKSVPATGTGVAATDTRATTDNCVPATVPLWQKISGIDPKREQEMTREERDAAIRKLVQEVHNRAVAEFESEDGDTIPEGERSIFWDPMQRICMQLGISRTKLSGYSRELTGLRAHELSDRILAKRKLPERLTKWVKELVGLEMNSMREMFAKARMDGHFRQVSMARMVKTAKSYRVHELKAHFAAQMGFANFSRLSRACLLTFGKSLDHIEADLVRTYVQKFFDEFKRTTDEPPRRQEHQEQQKKESVLSPEARKVIDEAVATTIKQSFKVAS